VVLQRATISMKGLPGTRVTGGFLARTHNGDNVIQWIEYTKHFIKYLSQKLRDACVG